MLNFFKLEFLVVHILGKSYLSGALDAEIHLDAIGLSSKRKIRHQIKIMHVKAMILSRHHLDECLKIEYLIVKDHFVLWNN